MRIGDGGSGSPHRWGAGFLVTEVGRNITAHLFDEEWRETGTVTLVAGPVEPMAHHSVVGDGLLFLAFSASVDSGANVALYLRSFDANLSEARRATIEERSQPRDTDRPPEDLVLAAHKGKLYLGTVHVGQPTDGLRLRVFNRALQETENVVLEGAAMEGGGSFLFDEDGLLYITGASQAYNSTGPRDIRALTFDGEWKLVGNRALTVGPADEHLPMGVWTERGAYYVTYVVSAGREKQACPPCDAGAIELRVFDSHWRLVYEILVVDGAELANRPHLLRWEGATYVVYNTAYAKPGAWVTTFEDEEFPS